MGVGVSPSSAVSFNRRAEGRKKSCSPISIPSIISSSSSSSSAGLNLLGAGLDQIGLASVVGALSAEGEEKEEGEEEGKLMICSVVVACLSSASISKRRTERVRKDETEFIPSLHLNHRTRRYFLLLLPQQLVLDLVSSKCESSGEEGSGGGGGRSVSTTGEEGW